MNEHLLRFVSKEEAKQDCCGDRYECNVVYVCSCGLKACRGCMQNHIFVLHWDEAAAEQRRQQELKESALRKLAAMTPAEK